MFDEKIPGNYYTRHVLGMFLVGVLIYLMHVNWGHYYVEGVGYGTVQDVLSAQLTSVWFLLLLFAVKILATCLTIGSGGSGGIFSPSLFLGATLGGAYGWLLSQAFPSLPVSPPAFAVVGMAGVVSGVTGAAITSIVLIFEMTLDYNVILPMTITVAISYGIRTMLSKDSIYTEKLTRRGHYMPEALQANLHFLKLAREVMEPALPVLPASAPLETALKCLNNGHRHCLVEERDQVFGVLGREAAFRALLERGKGVPISEVADRDYQPVSETTTLFEIIGMMRGNQRRWFVVVENAGSAAEQVKGVISKERIADSMADPSRLFAE